MSDFTYFDCVLTISDEDNISIECIIDGKTKVTDGNLSSDKFAYLTVERLNHWVNYALRMQDKGVTEKLYDLQDLKVIGLNLYSILFADDKIRTWFHDAYDYFDLHYHQEKVRNQEEDPHIRMRLKLIFHKPAENLGRLPWEFLFIPADKSDIERGFFFSGQKTELILTRFVQPPNLLQKQEMEKFLEQFEAKQEDLRILIAVSRAEVGLGKIDEKETDALVKEIQDRVRANLTVLKDPSYNDLREHIDTIVKPHILHFIGHGKPGGLAIFKDPQDPDYDVDEGGKQIRWITSQQFRNLFNNVKPRLVFLHACKGAAPDSHEGFNSTARELVYAEISAVVAMQYSISNLDAGKFARKFYQEIGNGRDIDEAVKAGRMELGETFPPWEHPRFGTPVVYLLTEKPIVLSVPEEPELKDKTKTIQTSDTQSAVSGQVAGDRLVVGDSRAGLSDRTASAPAGADTDSGN